MQFWRSIALSLRATRSTNLGILLQSKRGTLRFHYWDWSSVS